MADELTADDAPASIPNYLADGLPKQDTDTLHDVIDFAEELIEDKQRSVEPELPDDADVVEDDDSSTKGTIVVQKVTCGDETCHCADGDKHGPYKYRYYRNAKGKVTSDYLGKAE